MKRAEPGEKVALVGLSGSGKSTVTALIPRFYDVARGAVLLDGHDVRDVTLRSLRAQIGVAFEESFLFSDTIRANIAYGRPGASQEEVETVAQQAQAHSFILQLPHGYDTVVGERGLRLSGGQRQRVALARALLTDPRVLILDDATSAVDSGVEDAIHQSLREVMRGRTTLLVAHREATLRLADRIVVVDRGAVLDQGSHQQLMERCAPYRLLLSGPAPITQVRLASLLALEPHLLTRNLQGRERQVWLRLVGNAAQPPSANNIVVFATKINAAWGRAVTQLRGMGEIHEDLNAGTWAEGSATSQYQIPAWADGRADFVLRAVSRISFDVLTADLSSEDRAWVNIANVA